MTPYLYVIKKKKKLTHGAKHGASERLRMYHKAKEMLQRARQPKHGGYQSVFERWHNDHDCRNSLSLIGWTEEHIIQHDKLALEDHSCIATLEERTRNEKNWVLSLNKQGVLNQRPDFVEAKRELKRLHDEHLKETSEEIHRFILHNEQDNEETNKGQRRT